MRTKIQTQQARKSGQQLIQEQLKELNTYLKTADLSIVYESIEKANASK